MKEKKKGFLEDLLGSTASAIAKTLVEKATDLARTTYEKGKSMATDLADNLSNYADFAKELYRAVADYDMNTAAHLISEWKRVKDMYGLDSKSETLKEKIRDKTQFVKEGIGTLAQDKKTSYVWDFEALEAEKFLDTIEEKVPDSEIYSLRDRNYSVKKELKKICYKNLVKDYAALIKTLEHIKEEQKSENELSALTYHLLAEAERFLSDK